MEIRDINAALAAIETASRMQEEILLENGGEVTEEVESMEQQMADLQVLLSGEGIDTLGRWLKSKEDRKAALKAEKARIDQMMKATDNTIDYIKRLAYDVIRHTGRDKAKGLLYSFVPYTSEKTEVDKDRVNELYRETAENALKAAGVPDYITLTLGASVKRVEEGEPLPDVFSVSRENTCRFNKPRMPKEDK